MRSSKVAYTRGAAANQRVETADRDGPAGPPTDSTHVQVATVQTDAAPVTPTLDTFVPTVVRYGPPSFALDIGGTRAVTELRLVLVRKSGSVTVSVRLQVMSAAAPVVSMDADALGPAVIGGVTPVKFFTSALGHASCQLYLGMQSWGGVWWVVFEWQLQPDSQASMTCAGVR